MTNFGTASLANLGTAHEVLAAIARDVDEIYPHSVREAYRDDVRQQELYDAGHSKAEPGKSKHNHRDKTGAPCSHALDAYPDGITAEAWREFCEKGREAVELMPRFAMLAGAYIMAGRKRGVIMRWGGDWDGDTKALGAGFLDAPHVEIIGFLPGFII